MVRHVILWKLKEAYSATEKESIKAGIKNSLESLNGVIPGLIEISVVSHGLESSTADLMLDSVFESADALKEYARHPAHQQAANSFVRPHVQTRLCLDFENSGTFTR